ncbi:MAG: twin-arginine translocase subunit TatC [Lentisphaerae bacterium]|nr:twin-arginine translocase subunit TatC [Lentisphaerota bacterium]
MTAEEPSDAPRPFLEHLEDLRRTILGSVACLAIGMAVAVPLTPSIFKFLMAPLGQITTHPEDFLRSLDVAGGFSIALQMMFWCGILFSLPIILALIARFIFPGLTARERQAIFQGLGLAVLLFAAGVALGYYYTLPVALKIMFGLHTWLGIKPEWTAVSYIAFALQLLVAFGLSFELPVILLVLGRLGIVTSAQMASKRRHAVIVILVLAMFMTPGPDVFSQVVMAVPMIILYEMCIWLTWLYERKKNTPP